MIPSLRFRFLLSLILITAFCSYAYELVLAQILSILWGDIVLQYTVTTGVYIASMGMGAFVAPTRRSAERSFIWLEVCLSAVAIAAPFCLVAADVYYRSVATVISYAFIVLIGFFSGMELPLLLRVLHEESSTERAPTERALFIDYLGMFFAGLLFALYLNRTWGTLKTSLWLALANLGLALLCGLVWGFRNRKLWRIEVPIILIGFSFFAWFITQYLNSYQDKLEKWVIGN
jgi:spermidine synthase